MKRILTILLLIICQLAGVGQTLSPIIPDERIIPWDPGVRGGVPDRQTIYTTISAGATAATINAAIAACPSNQVVLLSEGVYAITAKILIAKSGVTLRGAGMGLTILSNAPGFPDNQIIHFNNNYDYNWDAGPIRDILNTVKGSSYITSSLAHGYSEGEYVGIDQVTNNSTLKPLRNRGTLGDCNYCGRPETVGNRPNGQLGKVTNVVSTTVFQIDPAPYAIYSNAPQAFKISGLVYRSGVEDLTIANSSTSINYNTQWEGAIECWVVRCHIRGIHKRAYWVYGALWPTIEGNRITGGVPVGNDSSAQYTSELAYGGFLGPHCTAGLVTANWIEKVTMAISFEGAASGNVFSYNYTTNIWWNSETDPPRRFGVLMHGPHPTLNLIEGNWLAGRTRADEYFGTSDSFVNLRNRVLQVDRGSPSSQTWTYDIERGNRNWVFLGEVAGGAPGVNENNYEFIFGESAPYDDNNATIWKLGYNSLGSGSTSYDNYVWTNTIRWGCWTYRTNDSVSGSGQVWHTNDVLDVAYTTITNSFYTTTAPTNFGILSFPPYEPNRAITLNTATNIPAGHWALLGSLPPSSGGSPPTSDAVNARTGTGRSVGSRSRGGGTGRGF
jgi:Pectate lyase superfamily protein